jgi:septal ring factor EnvC (AmiA/AmiB activator)
LKGISLQTREEARITAPADGWVVYAGPFRSYGQLLIINAGGGYHILLAGMSRIDVSLGQFVLAGEPIAVMGSLAASGSSGKDSLRPVLYVEFRKDGRPVDPGPWWAAASGKVQG